MKCELSWEFSWSSRRHKLFFTTNPRSQENLPSVKCKRITKQTMLNWILCKFLKRQLWESSDGVIIRLAIWIGNLVCEAFSHAMTMNKFIARFHFIWRFSARMQIDLWRFHLVIFVLLTVWHTFFSPKARCYRRVLSVREMQSGEKIKFYRLARISRAA